MALELNIFLLILGAAAVLYLSGVICKIPHLFLFGCILCFGGAALLWSSGGLVTQSYYDVEGVLVQSVLPMTNIGLAMFAFVLVGIPLISFLVMDFNPKQARVTSPFHY